MSTSYDITAAWELLKRYPKGINKGRYCRKLSFYLGKVFYSTDQILMTMEQHGFLAWESDDEMIGCFEEGEI